jgi:hypothetical protein
MPSTVQVEGTRELAALLRRIADKDLQKALRSAHIEASRLVVAQARSLVPVRTGNLQSSIRAGGTQRAAVVRAGTPTKAPYATPIHFGRKRGNVGRPPGNRKGENVIEGRPFLYDAGQRVAPAALELYRRDIADVLMRASAAGV